MAIKHKFDAWDSGDAGDTGDAGDIGDSGDAGFAGDTGDSGDSGDAWDAGFARIALDSFDPDSVFSGVAVGAMLTVGAVLAVLGHGKRGHNNKIRFLIFLPIFN